MTTVPASLVHCSNALSPMLSKLKLAPRVTELTPVALNAVLEIYATLLGIASVPDKLPQNANALAAIDVRVGSSSTLLAVQQYGPGDDNDEQPRGDG